MSMEIATRSTGTSLSTAPEKNAFEAYSESVAGNRIVGDLLRFAKGDWLKGRDKEDVAVGTRLIAAVDETVIGWMLWEDSKVVDLRIGRVAEGFQPPSRKELGHDDESQWPTDDNGVPQDPWQLTSYLILKEESDDQLYTYTPASAGGRNAVAKLVGEYGKRYRQKPNEYPIVSLGVDAYNHPDKKRGRIKVPRLTVVGWVDKGKTVAAITGEAAEAAQQAEETAEQTAKPMTLAESAKDHVSKKSGKQQAETRF